MAALTIASSLFILSLPAVILLCYGGWLSAYDIRTHRLPNKHVLMMTLLVFVTESVICWAVGEWSRLFDAFKTCAFITLFYFGLYVLSRRQLGMGDVKYAIPTGLVLGFYGPQAWLVCILFTFALAGLTALVGMLVGRLTRSSRMAFGPYMTFSTLILVLFSSLNSP
jgi:leader peptidase (prepilin peptidase)/N-methyltransferase